YARRGNTMRINGIDAELLDLAAVKKMMPFLNFDNARFPVQGGLLQRRGGTARHDAVVWGYAHAASALGSTWLSMGIETMPIESHVLQAFVSEAIKPLIPNVMTFGAGHFYVSQSDKGGLVFGGDIDGYNSYAQRGNMPVMEDVCEGGMALMPMIGRVRLLRQWGGIMDMSMDGSPIIDKTPVDGLYPNA
ncbi:MAG: FAD-dependent oxidoreductase, partial [Mesorhizobium sp.]